MELYFNDQNGAKKLVANPSDAKECNAEIRKFLRDHNCKSYCTIAEEKNGHLKINVPNFGFFTVEGLPLWKYTEAKWEEDQDEDSSASTEKKMRKFSGKHFKVKMSSLRRE